MEIVKLSLGQMGTNCYILWDETSLEAAVVDPGFEDSRVLSIIDENQLKVQYILLTHGHFDHLGGVDTIRNKTGAKVLMHEKDADCLTEPRRNLSILAGINLVVAAADQTISEGETLFLGKTEIKVIETPGHSKGGICFLVEESLIAGDTLFNGSIGRTDFVDGDLSELLESIRKKIFVLGDEITVLPGHGENTNVGYEKKYNPFLTSQL